MLRFLLKLILINICILSSNIQAQKNVESNNTQLSNNTELDDYEYAEKINEAVTFLNNNKEKEGYKIGHELLKKKTDIRSKLGANFTLAYYFLNKSLIDSSLYYVNKTFKYQPLIKNDSLKQRSYSLSYNLLAINNRKKGLLEESNKWHIKGIEVSKKYKEEEFYYTHIHGLANNYQDLQNYERSLKLFNECLTYKDDPEIILGSYINIGGIYSLLEDYSQSNKYLNKALKLAEKYKNYLALISIKMNMGINYQKQNKLDKALLLYKGALLLAEEKGNKQLAMKARLDIGSVYYKLKQYKEAELLYSSNLHDAIALGYLKEQYDIYNKLKNISVAQKKYRNAFNFATKSFKINDSINRLQKDKEIDELEVRYKTLEKEKEIKLLQIENSHHDLELKNQKEAIQNLELKQKIEEKENENKILSFQNASEKKLNEIALLKKNQEIQEAKLVKEKSVKNIILYSFLILLVPVIGLLIIYYQKIQTQSELSKKQEEVNNQKITTLIKDQELKVIKASIKGKDKERKRIAQELHDSIGGNLAAIKLKLNNSVDTRGDYLSVLNNQIDDTYEQVRNLSHNLIPKKFSKNNFCDILEEYINSIWGANSSFMVYPRSEIDLLNENLQIEIFKIIQELATNTIKHAQATSIELQVNLVDKELNILFEDNGIGFNTKNHKEGIGFENIKNRLKKFQGTFYIDSRIDRGTIINIEIPTLTSVCIKENEIIL